MQKAININPTNLILNNPHNLMKQSSKPIREQITKDVNSYPKQVEAENNRLGRIRKKRFDVREGKKSPERVFRVGVFFSINKK